MHQNQNTELDEILLRLSMDQIRFVTARLETTTDKDAAEYLGMKPDTIKKWKRAGVPIDDACRLMVMDGIITARHILKRNLTKAVCVKVKGLESDDEKIRQATSTEVLDRTLGKSTQSIRHSGEIKTDDLSDEARIDRLAALLDKARDRRSGSDSSDN